MWAVCRLHMPVLGCALAKFSPKKFTWNNHVSSCLTLLHSERPKLYTILAFLSAIGLKLIHIRSSVLKFVYNFGLSECNRVKANTHKIKCAQIFLLKKKKMITLLYCKSSSHFLTKKFPVLLLMVRLKV